MARLPTDATDSPDGRSRGVSRGSSWVLLPTVWCLWLLLWLAPSLLLEPHTTSPLAWLRAETAPAALVAGAAFFLVVVWPFWPALAARGGRDADATLRSSGAASLRSTSRLSWSLLGRSLAELLILAALAAPFVCLAWSVGGRPIDAPTLAATAGGLAALGLAIRLAHVAIGRASGRWLMLGAMLATAGPILVAYGAAETIGVVPQRLFEAIPVVAAVRLAMEGWPGAPWEGFARLVLWPGVAAVLVLAALVQMGRRGRVADDP